MPAELLERIDLLCHNLNMPNRSELMREIFEKVLENYEQKETYET